MTNSRRRRIFAALLVAACLPACSSNGALARRWQSSMLEGADPDSKVVVIRVKDIGRLTATSGAVSDLERAPGVMSARRGAGDDELYALVEGFVKPDTLVASLERDGHDAWFVRVVTRADLEAQDEQKDEK